MPEILLVNSSQVSNSHDKAVGAYHWHVDRAADSGSGDIIFSVDVPSHLAMEKHKVRAKAIGIVTKKDHFKVHDLEVRDCTPSGESACVRVTLAPVIGGGDDGVPWPLDMIIQFLIDYSDVVMDGDPGSPGDTRRP